MAFNPKSLRYNQHGVPYLRATEIESIAYEVLEKYCPQALKVPSIVPVAEIIVGLHENTGLLLRWEDLGSKGPAKILGKVNFRQRTLFLDVSLDKELKPAFRFTAAHEIGHWVLHRYNWKNLRLDVGKQPADEFDDDQASLCRLDQRTPRDWLEYQANVFASSLVMPRAPFQEAVASAQIEMGIKRNLGVVYRNPNYSSTRDFQQLVSRLVLKFDVSRASVEVRLRTLKLLMDEAAQGTKSAKQIILTGNMNSATV